MSDRTDAVFFALSDPTRREVIARLNAEGALSASDLAARMPVSRQAIAKHLAALGDAGLVERASSGREILYRLTPEPMVDAMDWMTDVGARWDERIRKLKRIFDRG